MDVVSVLVKDQRRRLKVVRKYPSIWVVFVFSIPAGYCFFPSQILDDVRLPDSNTAKVGSGQEYDTIERSGAWYFFYYSFTP